MSHHLTRRALVAATPAITGLSIAALGATAALALPSAAGLDAELLALGVELTSALALKDELTEAADRAYERYKPTPIPEALFWRPSDVPAVWNANPGLNLDGISGRDDDERHIHARGTSDRS